MLKIIKKLQLKDKNHSYKRHNFVKLSQQLKIDKIPRSVVDYLWGQNIKIKIPKSVTINNIF